MTIEQAAVVCGIMFVASIVRSTLGFGEALIAMPLLAFVVPIHVASPLVAVLSMLNAVLILAREWRSIRWHETVWLTCSALLGVPLGAWLLKSSDEVVIKILLAAVVLGFSSWSLFHPGQFVLRTDRLAPLFGLAAGILGGAYNTAGPPLVIFGTLRQWPADSFRANLQSYFLLGGTAALGLHFYHGRVTGQVGLLSAVCVPFVLLSAVIGRRLTMTIPRERFLRWVHVGLLLIGVLLIVTCALG